MVLDPMAWDILRSQCIVWSFPEEQGQKVRGKKGLALSSVLGLQGLPPYMLDSQKPGDEGEKDLYSGISGTFC